MITMKLLSALLFVGLGWTSAVGDENSESRQLHEQHYGSYYGGGGAGGGYNYSPYYYGGGSGGYPYGGGGGYHYGGGGYPYGGGGYPYGGGGYPHGGGGQYGGGGYWGGYYGSYYPYYYGGRGYYGRRPFRPWRPTRPPPSTPDPVPTPPTDRECCDYAVACARRNLSGDDEMTYEEAVAKYAYDPLCSVQCFEWGNPTCPDHTPPDDGGDPPPGDGGGDPPPPPPQVIVVGPDVWTIPGDGGPLPAMTATTGDTMTFSWQGVHNVYLHPSGTCDTTGSSVVATTPGESYTFSQPGTYSFACQIGEHCDLGMIMTVTVV